MSIEDYESLRRSRPELKLPAYQLLRRPDRRALRRKERVEVIAMRTGKLLANEPGWIGRVQRRRLSWLAIQIQSGRILKGQHN